MVSDIVLMVSFSSLVKICFSLKYSKERQALLLPLSTI
jgi:hypothetical protein